MAHDPIEPMQPDTDPLSADRGTDRRALLAGLGGLAAGAFLAGKAQAGPLNPPPGPIAPTPGPEPRTPIGPDTTPGDGQNMFRITQRGSYYLTGNLTHTGDRNGILIEADDVTIDLMGFVMVGNSAATVAIFGAAPLRNITVRNGSIRSWIGGGINLGPASDDMCRFENLTISRCFSDGLACLTAAQVVDCQAFINDGHGFRLGASSTVTRCIARQNSGSGFNLGAASTVIECSAILSGLGGFDISFGSLVRACLARSNLREGIIAGGGSTVESCNATLNAWHGIRIAGDGTVRNNDCAANGQANLNAGLFCSGSDSRIESNNCTNNGVGIRVALGGNIILGNTCSGSVGDNFVIAAGNRYGPIVNLTAQTAPAVAGSTAADSTGTTHPWANFAY